MTAPVKSFFDRLADASQEKRRPNITFTSSMRGIFCERGWKEGASEYEPLTSSFCEVRDENALLESLQDKETFHKRLSITLLALSVATIATGVILAIKVNPLLGIIALGCLITTVGGISGIYSIERPGSDPMAMNCPIIAEAMYVCEAFGIDARKQKVARDIEAINRLEEPLRALAQNEELYGGLTADAKGNKNLSSALKELQRLREFFARN